MPKRKRTKKGGATAYDLKQDAKIRRLEKHVIYKQHTVVQTSTALADGTMQEFVLSAVAQGETDLTREGASIILDSVSIRIALEGSPIITTFSGSIRVLLLIDNDPRGALPGPTDMLTTQDILSGYNTGRVVGQERNRGRFKFIYDETFDLINRPVAAADSVPQHLTIHIYKKLKHIECTFTSDAGTIAASEQNTLIIAFLAQDNSVDSTMRFNSVVRFISPD